MDGFFNTKNEQVSFSFNPMYENHGMIRKYIEWYAFYLGELAAVPGSKIVYAADDVPVIRHFNYPLLSAFKLFYWSKAVLNAGDYVAQKFKPGVVSEELLEINRKTFKAYSEIDVTEVWCEETISSTLKQVHYYWDCDLFESKDIALRLVDEIRQMVSDMMTECEENGLEGRARKGSFNLYNSDLMIGNNCVLIEPANKKYTRRVFLGHNTFNTISTYNEAFLRETSLWMNNLMKKSMLLTGSAEKQRNIFFKRIHNKIDALEKAIQLND
jgi:hypothetical protein